MDGYERVLHGNSEAFDQLYRQYYPVVYTMRKKYYLKGFDQEDWLQEGRIIFYKSLEKYEKKHNVSIGKFFKMNFENHVRSLVRKQCAVKRTIDTNTVSLDQKVDNQGESFFDYLGMEEGDALEQMIIREKLEQLPTMLSAFEQATFQDYLNGNELEDIAQKQAVKEIKIRSAYDRAKKKIKSLIYD